MRFYSDSSAAAALSRSVEGLDAENSIDALGGSEKLYEDLLLQIVRLTPGNVECMDECLRTGDSGLFGLTAHGIKGSLRQAGYSLLSNMAETMEKAAKAGDLLYCRLNYKPFREALITFTDAVKSAFSESRKQPVPDEDKPEGRIDDYNEILLRVKDALEDYDILSAAELLEPLEKIRFGHGADELIAKTADSLKSYQVQESLEHINRLLK